MGNKLHVTTARVVLFNMWFITLVKTLHSIHVQC